MSYDCSDCGTIVELLGIYPKEMDGKLHNDQRCMALVKAQRDAAIQGNTCDACLGNGKPISGLPCMCRGTGKMAEAARYLREQLVQADTKIADALAELESAMGYLRYGAHGNVKSTHGNVVINIEAARAALNRRLRV